VQARRQVYGATALLLFVGVVVAIGAPTDPRSWLYLAFLAVVFGLWGSIAFKGWRARRGLAKLRAQRAADRSPFG
jgi:hypothetical protein